MSPTLRSRVDKLTSGRGSSVWLIDVTSDGDGRCRPVGPDHDQHPGVTVAELDARPDRELITLIELIDDGPA